MKKLILMFVIAGSILSSLFTGCVVRDDHYYHRNYYHHRHYGYYNYGGY